MRDLKEKGLIRREKEGEKEQEKIDKERKRDKMKVLLSMI